ncbi:hypothetical protein BDV33DRAFT_210134 [Aspergillus novoparasiticus]|uniref:Myb-like domain-containing protein n=1 Tax=Aspergillus novoparasiticus TaxID=986946 RepID=A0A5N6E9N5_9EURO|nr:hypothetical protein BDV33DRAFT_210134 [Aspergillus novoparasiticus]
MVRITSHTRIVQQPDLERPCDHVNPDGAVRDITQNQNTSHVVTREPAQPEASASNDNKTASQSSVQQSISQEWPNREMCQLVGDVYSSDPASITAEAEQDLLGPSIATKLRRDSILLSEGCSEINAQISSPAASSHSAYTSRSPSADLSVSFNTSSHSRDESRAETMECDEATLQNIRNDIRDYQDQGECLDDEATIGRRVKNNRLLVITRSSPASNAEGGILKEIQPSAVSSPNRPLCSTRLSKMPLTGTRSLRSRPNANTDPERLPSVSVVIIVREPDRLIADTTRNCQIRSRNDGRQNGSKSDDADDCTGVQNFPNKQYCSEAKRPRRRRNPGALSRKAMESKPVLTKHATGKCANIFQNLSNSDKTTAHEAQEIFGRGILRIQPHGHRCTYSFTFLPEAVYSELPSPPPRVSPEHSTCSDSRSQSQSSRRATRRRQYKRIPYTPTENQRLTELRRQHGLPWREVAKHFKQRTQASLQVQYSKIRSVAAYKARDKT